MRCAKPYPVGDVEVLVNELTRPYWSEAGRGRLVAARCASCGAFRAPPTPYCPVCLSGMLEWPVLSGRAELYSYTVINRSRLPEAPEFYVPAIVTLPDAPGIRLVTNIATEDIDALAIGLPLQVRFHPLGRELALPFFVPAS